MSHGLCLLLFMKMTVTYSQEQAMKMKEILKVLEAMRSEEMATPLAIKGAQKERIAMSAGVVS